MACRSTDLFNRTHFYRCQRANALIELLIVIPVLILVLGGIIDFGLSFREHAIMVESARVGARAAAAKTYELGPSALNAMAKNRASEWLSNAGLPSDEYNICVARVDLHEAAMNQPNAWGIGVKVEREALGGFSIIRNFGFMSRAKSVFLAPGGVDDLSDNGCEYED